MSQGNPLGEVFQGGVSVGMEFAAIDFEIANEQRSSAPEVPQVAPANERQAANSGKLIDDAMVPIEKESLALMATAYFREHRALGSQ